MEKQPLELGVSLSSNAFSIFTEKKKNKQILFIGETPRPLALLLPACILRRKHRQPLLFSLLPFLVL